jgi:hypothetical protein
MTFRTYLPDANTTFAAVTVSTATTSYGSAIDLGTTTGMQLDAVLNVATLDVADGDETYTIGLQLGDSADFDGATVERCSIRLGDSTQLALNSADSSTGRVVLGADNVLFGTGYRYARVFVTAAGTTPSIVVSGFLALNGGFGGGAF